MTRLIAVADRIRDQLGAATILVHHSGKDPTRGARGHSALFGAADTVIRVESGAATVEKVRDGVAGERFSFRLDIVKLGVDDEGDPITTCLVDHSPGGIVESIRARTERDGVLAALRASDDVPAAVTGPRTPWHVLSARPEFPAALRDGREGRRRFWAVLEQLRGMGIAREASIRRADRHSVRVIEAVSPEESGIAGNAGNA